MPLGLTCPLSLSLSASHSLTRSSFGPAGSALSSQQGFAGAVENEVSRVWAWLCWPWLSGVSRSWAGLADIISQIWPTTANIKFMHENVLDQFQRQQSQRGIEHREKSCWKGRSDDPLTFNSLFCILYIDSDSKAKCILIKSYIALKIR